MLTNNNNQYHTDRYPDVSYGYTAPHYHLSGSTPPPTDPPKPKKRRGGAVAALLAVSLVSGAAGGGATYLLMDGTRPAVVAEAAADSAEIAQEAYQSATEAAAGASSGGTSDIAGIVAKTSDSVVEITVEVSSVHPFFGEYTNSGSGSGVILTEDGYIVTNNHVVEGATSITVRTKDGSEYAAVLVGTDEKTDLSVVHIDAAGLQAVTFADSDQINVGELAVAIGNPLGTLGGTVTNGIVSAKDREITIGDQTMSLLQTSAAVNPGNSGGGLFNSDGNLIGIVNAKSAGSEIEGLGFAIPSNTVRQVVDDIIANGYVTGRTEFGISVLEISDAQSAARYRVSEPGVYVAAITRENGFAEGDRIVSIGGTSINSLEDLKTVLSESTVGDTLQARVVRGGVEMTVDVTVSEQVPEYVREQLAASQAV